MRKHPDTLQGTLDLLHEEHTARDLQENGRSRSLWQVSHRSLKNPNSNTPCRNRRQCSFLRASRIRAERRLGEFLRECVGAAAGFVEYVYSLSRRAGGAAPGADSEEP